MQLASRYLAGFSSRVDVKVSAPPVMVRTNFEFTPAQQQPFSHTLFAEAAAGLGHVTFVGSSGDRPNWFSAGFNFGTCRC